MQNTIDGLKSITKVALCVADTDGKVVASTFEAGENYASSIAAFVDAEAESQVIGSSYFFKIFDNSMFLIC